MDFIYEPPQEGTAERLMLHRHTQEEQQVGTGAPQQGQG